MSASFAFPPPPPPPPKAAPAQISAGAGAPSSSQSRGNRQQNGRGGRGGRGARGGRGGRGNKNDRRGTDEPSTASNDGIPQLKSTYKAASSTPSADTAAAAPNAQLPAVGPPPTQAYPYGYPAAQYAQAQQAQQAQDAAQWYQAAAAAQYAQYAQYAAASAAYQSQAYAAYPQAAANQYGQQMDPYAAAYYAQAWASSAMQPQAATQTVGPAPFHGANGPHTQGRGRHGHTGQGRADGFHGTKRKRESLQGSHSTSHGRPSGQKPKVQVAPAVPNFGFSFPSLPAKPPAAVEDSKSKKKKKKKQREFNQLGLTPRQEEHEDSEEDVDEEALAASNGGVLQVEYQGLTQTLGSSREIAAWIEERKKRYPTLARVAAKKAEQAKQSTKKEEARRKLHKEASKDGRLLFGHEVDARRRAIIADHLEKAERVRDRIKRNAEKAGKAAARAAEVDPLQEDVPNCGPHNDKENTTPDEDEHHAPQTLDEMIAEIASGKPAKQRTMADLNLDYSSDGAGADSESDSSVSVSSSDTSSCSSGSTSTSRRRGPKRSSQAKQPSQATAPEEAQPRKLPQRRVCQALVRSGKCQVGAKCRFSHAWEAITAAREEREKQKKANAPAPRLTLHQQFLQQEQKEEDVFLLNVIKYLGQRGMLTV